MQLVHFFIASLCCCVVRVARATGEPGSDVVSETTAVSPVVQPKNLAKRTLREEFIIFVDLMDAWGTANKDVKLGDSKVKALDALVTEAVDHLYLLSVNIGIDLGIDGIFAVKNDNDPVLPNYIGTNRYKFVVGIVYSMAKKMMALRDYLATLKSEETPVDLKTTLLKFNIAKADEIDKTLLSLPRVKQFVSEYFGEEAPITLLLKDFTKLEEHLKTMQEVPKNPFGLHYVSFKDVEGAGDKGPDLIEADSKTSEQAQRTVYKPFWSAEHDAIVLSQHDIEAAEADVRSAIAEAALAAERASAPGYRVKEPTPLSPHVVIPGADGGQPTIVLPMPFSKIDISEETITQPPQQRQETVDGVTESHGPESTVTGSGPDPAASSLRQEGEVQTTTKPSSAFGSFVTATVFVSIAFAL